MPEPAQDKAQKLSETEHIKAASNYLRGTIREELATDEATFAKETTQVIKHHGMYQQEDRDRRLMKTADGKRAERAYSLMVRVKIPGGRLTAGQFLSQLDLCDELGNATLRITNRQDIQLHGVVKRNIRETIQRINDVQLTTLGACGDVERNVMCCPAPYRKDPVHTELQVMARQLSDALLPQTRAYHEVWLTDPLTGEKELAGGGGDGAEVEPLYGKTYLPRKFKTAIALTGDNCTDIYANDLGFLAICRDYSIVGYNVLVGGGFGVTPSAKNTFPTVAQRMAFVQPGEVVEVAKAVIAVQRDFGNRSDRKRARLKYLIHDWGLPRFKAKVEEYLGRALPGPDRDDVRGFEDHIGWDEQGDGLWFLGLNVENGRVLDRDGFRLKTALREVCRRFDPGVRLTAHQSILFSDVRPEDRGALEEVLRSHGVKLENEISTVRRWSMACVALPTCPLAVTESERVLPGVIDQLEAELAQLGLERDIFTVRMTGCPNGCARPYNADVGLVGRTKNKYTIYLGGRRLGDRLAEVFKELVPLEEIIPTLLPVFSYFQKDRSDGETFGDFCHRKGMADLAARAEQAAAQA